MAVDWNPRKHELLSWIDNFLLYKFLLFLNIWHENFVLLLFIVAFFRKLLSKLYVIQLHLSCKRNSHDWIIGVINCWRQRQSFDAWATLLTAIKFFKYLSNKKIWLIRGKVMLVMTMIMIIRIVKPSVVQYRGLLDIVPHTGSISKCLSCFNEFGHKKWSMLSGDAQMHKFCITVLEGIDSVFWHVAAFIKLILLLLISRTCWWTIVGYVFL